MSYIRRSRKKSKAVILFAMDLRDIWVNIGVFFSSFTICYTKLVTRQEWGARDPVEMELTLGESPFVVVHHSAKPAACYTESDCKQALRAIQDLHQLENGWDDIGYNFAIGSDGNIYEGRGFNVVGAHARGYNKQSVGICLIGDWTVIQPPKIMLTRLQQLIQFGIKMNFIRKDYKLYGHRQLASNPTLCPGTELFKLIQNWKHFNSA